MAGVGVQPGDEHCQCRLSFLSIFKFLFLVVVSVFQCKINYLLV